MLDFTGQRVIVTGGTRGIGRAITEAFVARGAHVTATYAGAGEPAEKLRAAHPDQIALARFDVADYAACARFVEGLPAAPEVLVNNAGIRRDAIVGLMSPEDWRRVLAVNLDGAFHMSKLCVQLMSRKRYGRIVSITSPSADLGIKGQAAYAASKAGMEAMSRALSKEVATRNITVNCVEPGYVDTELLQGLDVATKAEYAKQVPLGRFGTAEEVAASVLFIASKEASYITGTTLRVAGGL